VQAEWGPDELIGAWTPRQADYCRLVGKPARAADALEQGKEELHTALAEMENALPSSQWSSPAGTGAYRPYPDAAVVPGGGDQGAVRAERHAVHPAVVAGEGTD
jgi:hypothetical protein